MNIVIKLEQRDFEGNKEVFDRMYALCGALNPRKDESAHLSKETVEKSAGVIREQDESQRLPPVVPAADVGLLMGQNVIPLRDVQVVGQVDHWPEQPQHEGRIHTFALEDVSPEPVPAADENAAYTIEQVRTAFSALSKSKGKETAKGILADLGVARVPDLPKNKYAEAMARIKAVK